MACTRDVARPFASLLALAVTGFAICAVTWPGRAAGERRLAASLLPDVTPTGRLAPTGDIRVERRFPRWDNKNTPVAGHVRGYACDDLCVALLFLPDVRSVTVNGITRLDGAAHRAAGAAPLATSAVTYRLVRKADCGTRAIDLDGLNGQFGRNLDENRRIAAGWNLKLANDWCIVREAPLARFDLLLREGQYDFPAEEPKAPSLWLPSPARVTYAELRDATGKIVLRRFVSAVQVLSQPLAYLPNGGLENFRFGWNRTRLSNASSYPEPSLDKLLAEFTTLGQPAPPGDLLPAMRRTLQGALADPALTARDPAYATLDAYFDAAGRPLSPEDEVLVEALIGDERLTDYTGLYRLNGVPAAQHRRLRAAIVDRLLAARDPDALRSAGFGNFLSKSPPGSFATLTTAEERLLAAPDRRPYATGLIARLSDRGAVVVPQLVGMLRHHGSVLGDIIASERTMEATLRSRHLEAADGVIEAVRVALCRLGPAAAVALPEVEEMIAGGVLPPRAMDRFNGSDWQFTLVRMGKPIESLRKPTSTSGTDADHRQRIRNKLARFDPERSCD